MKTPNKLPQEVVNLLTDRLMDEYDAMMFYRSAANWCENAGYSSIASFFQEEAKQEAEHAKGLEDYMVGWNVSPKLPRIDAPSTTFSSLVDVVEQSYDIEYDLYEQYEKISLDILKKDPCTFDFLAKYRTIQTESVREYSDMLNELKAVGPEKLSLYYWQQERFED